MSDLTFWGTVAHLASGAMCAVIVMALALSRDVDARLLAFTSAGIICGMSMVTSFNHL